MNKPYSFLLPSNITGSPSSQKLLKEIYVKSLVLIGLPVCIFFGIYDFFIYRYTTGTLAFLIMLTLCILLYDNLKTSEASKTGLLSEIIFRFILIIFSLFLIYTVGFEQSLSKIPWFFIAPALIFYSTQKKEALIWTACISSILVYFLFFTELNSSYDEIARLKTRFIFIFGMLTIVFLMTNLLVRSSIQRYCDNQIAIESINLELKNSEEKYRQLFNKAPVGIYEFDFLENRFLTVNDVMCTYSGYTEEELLSMSPLDLLTEESRKLYRKRAAICLAGGNVSENVEYNILKKDGTELCVLLNIDYLFADGELQGSRVVVHDLTDRKRMEEQLHHAQKMESIGTLSGGIAHNFNNLLMGIQGRISLISVDLEQAHPYTEHINAIKDCTQSAVDLTQQLLGLARGGKYEVKPVNLVDFVSENVATFGQTHKEIVIEIEAESSQIVSEVDRSQLAQVLLNLYLNAWQAMPGGGKLSLVLSSVIVDQTTSKLQRVEPGEYNRISVTDTGVGMDDATRQQVFDPFFTTREKSRGTGLGLSSAYGIVRNHGGIITVQSKFEQGTTFDIYLPASEKAVYQEDVQKGEIIKGSGTILLVDDEEMILDVTKAMLARLGYNIIVARNGQEAIEKVGEKGESIDLVILDMIMPGMDGRLVFDRIREIRPGLPVVLASGYNKNNRATKILKNGCNGFIQKPFSLSDISKKVQKILDEARSIHNQ